ncbi:MAG: hypothetical protein P8X79_14345 [Reinekea sp.]
MESRIQVKQKNKPKKGVSSETVIESDMPAGIPRFIAGITFPFIAIQVGGCYRLFTNTRVAIH